MMATQETKTDKTIKDYDFPKRFVEEDEIVDDIKNYLDREITRTKRALPVERAIALLNRKRFREVKDLSTLEDGLLNPSIINPNFFKGVFKRKDLLAEIYETNHWTDIPNTTKNFAKIRFRNIAGTYVAEYCFCWID